MTHIPIYAKVECADGPCGESVTVIVNPVTERVTHLVVQDPSLPYPDQRLVPMDHVADTSSDLVRLSCTREELGDLEPFIEVQHVKSDQPIPVYPMYDYYMPPYVMMADGVYMDLSEERVPVGEVAVRRGMRVEATDGHVGTVSELVVDDACEHVTHFVLQEGHLWGKKQVTLPVSALERVSENTMYVKLDKQAIDTLPAINLRRRKDRGETEEELLVKVFDSPDGAGKALRSVEDQHRMETIKILNAAVLVRAEDGMASVKDTRDFDPGKGPLLGAITGGLIGLVGGPAGVVVGALAGAGMGGLAGKWIDKGFSDKFLRGLQEQLRPGTSALVVLVEHEFALPLSEALATEKGVLFQQALTDILVEGILEADDGEG